MDFHRSGLIAFVNAGRAGGSAFCCLIGMKRSHKVGAMVGFTQHCLSVSPGTRSQSLSSRQMRRARVDDTW